MERVAQYMAVLGLTAMVIATPWAFGGNVAICKQWLFAAGLATCVPATILAILASRKIPLLGFLLGLAVLCGYLQVVPLESGFAKLLSSSSLDLRAASDHSVAAATSTGVPISIYPDSTRRDVYLLTLLAFVFLASSTAIKSRGAQIWLLACVSINGAFFALFGIVQQLTFDGRLYWRVPLRFGGQPFAAFVNRNHAGGYLNMCLAASLAFVIYATRRNQLAYGSSTNDYAQPLARGGRIGSGFRGLLANLDSLGLLALTFTALCGIGCVCSGSRGAVLALVGGVLVTFFAAGRKQGSYTLVLAGLVLLAASLGLSIWLGQTELLVERWGDTLTELNTQSNSRIDHWQDVVSACRDYWKFGTGLGTYRYAYRPYESQFNTGWFEHAENQYLESLVELGWLGPCLLIAAITLTVRGAFGMISARSTILEFAIGLSSLFMIVTQAIHACFDFGLYMPANGILCAMVAGLAVGKVADNRTAEVQWQRTPPLYWRMASLAVVLALGLSLAAGTKRAFTDTKIEAAFDQAFDLSQTEELDLSKIDASISSFEAALADAPNDAEAWFRLAELRIMRYRYLALEELKQATDFPPDMLHDLTLPIALHGRAHANLAQGRSLSDLRSQLLVQSEIVPSVEALLAARQSCSMMPKVHFRLAELFMGLPSSGSDTDSLQDEPLIETAVRMAPNDPDVLFRAGLLDWQAGRNSKARSEWKKSLSISAVHADKVFGFLSSNEDFASSLAEVVPTAPEAIAEVARACTDTQIRASLSDKLEDALPLAAATAGNREYLKASIFELRGQVSEAVVLLEQACDAQTSRLAWRYHLAELLLSSGRIDEAFEHASICVQAAPTLPAYRYLLDKIRQAAQDRQ